MRGQASPRGMELIKATGSVIAFNLFIALMFFGAVVATPIACIAIAATHDRQTSACTDLPPFEIFWTLPLDLQSFLYVAGGAQLAFYGLYGLSAVFLSQNVHVAEAFAIFGRCFNIFGALWAFGGIILFTTQMSNDCAKEPIGLMILCWCILELCVAPCLLCCVAVIAESLMGTVGAIRYFVQRIKPNNRNAGYENPVEMCGH